MPRFRLTITMRGYGGGNGKRRALHFRVIRGDRITAKREADAVRCQIAADRNVPATRLGIELAPLGAAFV